MNGFLLLIPFIAIRFGLLFVLNRKALQRAAYFAPMQGKEMVAYYIYQVSNIGIFLYLVRLTVKMDFSWQFNVGSVCYLVGLFLCGIAIANFSSPDDTGFNANGIYQFSRNPMYVAYFICFMGMALLTKSLIMLGLVWIFQISTHWIILAEERWCIHHFGENYKRYMQEVRRYI